MSESNVNGTAVTTNTATGGTTPTAPGAPVTKKLEIANVLVLPSLQSRVGGLDNGRCGQMAFVLKQNGHLPNMHAFEIDDKDHKHHGKTVLVGGFHRMEGHIIADRKEATFEVYKGTWADAVRAAACENKEHDAAGRYRSNEDKRKAVLMYCSSFANIPKVNWPNNREVSREIGVSHTFVDDMDPFGRGEKLTAKDEGGIRDRGEVKRKKKKNGKKKPTMELFDWTNYEQKVGYMARGLDTVAETYGVDKTSKAFKDAMNNLEQLTLQFKVWHDQFAKKGAAAQALAAVKKEAAKPKKKAKKAKATGPKDTTLRDGDGFPTTYSDTPAKVPEVASKA